MKAESMAMLSLTCKESVTNRLNGDTNHGWGVDDSTSVIETLVATDNQIFHEENPAKLAGTYTPSGECLAMISKLVNPSAFRQALEKAGKLKAPTPKADKKVSVLSMI